MSTTMSSFVIGDDRPKQCHGNVGTTELGQPGIRQPPSAGQAMLNLHMRAMPSTSRPFHSLLLTAITTQL